MSAHEQALKRQRAEIDVLRDQAAQRTEPELDALLESAEEDAQTQELLEVEPLRVYGFMDVGFQKNWGPLFDTGIAPSTASTFLVGNVNLYLDATPAPDWRSLVEVRVTNLPQGADRFEFATAQTTRQATAVQDTTATHGGFVSLELNGIVLERAHVDYMPTDWFNVRAGLFLTPYGIWNVDHGAPVRIVPRPPAIVIAGIWPERQTGIELFGTYGFLPWQLEYHLYVSNGRQLGAVDFDEDKAIGARLVLATRRPFGLRLGASTFHGSSEDVRRSPGVTESGELGLVPVTQVAYDETGGAGDISIDIERLRIRSEVMATLRTYETGKRDSYGGVPMPDSLQIGGYVLTAYELPWYHLEPYLLAELVRAIAPTIANGFAVLGGGLNIYFTPATQLRLYATHSWGVSYEGPAPRNTQINSTGARMVVAF